MDPSPLLKWDPDSSFYLCYASNLHIWTLVGLSDGCDWDIVCRVCQILHVALKRSDCTVLGASEITAKYFNCVHMYWKGCVICRIYCGNIWNALYVSTGAVVHIHSKTFDCFQNKIVLASFLHLLLAQFNI